MLPPIVSEPAEPEPEPRSEHRPVFGWSAMVLFLAGLVALCVYYQFVDPP